MDDLATTIAAHQAEYDDDLDTTVCTCGAWKLDEDHIDYSASESDINRMTDRQHAAHVAAAVHASRRVDSVEALNALPVGAVVRSRIGTIYEPSPTGEGDTTLWFSDGYGENVTDVSLPATVLWWPGHVDVEAIIRRVREEES